MQSLLEYQKQETIGEIQTFDIKDVENTRLIINDIHHPYIVRTENDIYHISTFLNKNYVYSILIKWTNSLPTRNWKSLTDVIFCRQSSSHLAALWLIKEFEKKKYESKC